MSARQEHCVDFPVHADFTRLSVVKSTILLHQHLLLVICNKTLSSSSSVSSATEQISTQLSTHRHLGCTLEVFHVHNYQFIHDTARLGRLCFFIFSLGLYCFNLFVYPHPFLFPWAVESFISLTVFGAGVTNLDEPPRVFATSTITWVRSQFHPFWAVVNKSNAGKGGYYVAGPPLLNDRCTSLLRAPVSEMTYTVSSGTLNTTIPYHYTHRHSQISYTGLTLLNASNNKLLTFTDFTPSPYRDIRSISSSPPRAGSQVLCIKRNRIGIDPFLDQMP